MGTEWALTAHYKSLQFRANTLSGWSRRLFLLQLLRLSCCYCCCCCCQPACPPAACQSPILAARVPASCFLCCCCRPLRTSELNRRTGCKREGVHFRFRWRLFKLTAEAPERILLVACYSQFDCDRNRASVAKTTSITETHTRILSPPRKYKAEDNRRP